MAADETAPAPASMPPDEQRADSGEPLLDADPPAQPPAPASPPPRPPPLYRRDKFSITRDWLVLSASILAVVVSFHAARETDRLKQLETTQALEKLQHGAWDALGGAENTAYIRSDVPPSAAKLELADRLLDQAESEYPPSSKTARIRGIWHRARGDTEKAIACCQEAVRLSSGDASAHVCLGNYLCDAGKVDEALEEYELVLKANPSDAMAIYNRGVVMRNRGQKDQALADFTQAAELAPEFPMAHRERAKLLMEANRQDEAIAAFATAISWGEEDISVFLLHATALDQARRPDAALAFEQARRRAPDDRAVLLAYASFALRHGRSSDALTALAHAMGLFPDDLTVLVMYCDALRENGQYSKALEINKRVRRLVPNDPAALNQEGGLLERLGSFDLALVAYDAALQFAPGNASLLSNRANALRELGRVSEAEAAAAAALSAAPDNFQFLINHALCLDALKKYEEALQELLRAQELQPDERLIQESLMREYALLNSPADALAIADNLLLANPHSADLLTARAVYLVALARYEDAKRAAEAALGEDEQSAEAWNAWGGAFQGTYDDARALEKFAKAVGFEPTRVEYQANRAITAHRLNRYDEALAAWEEVFKLGAPADCAARYHLDRAQVLLALGRNAEGKHECAEAHRLDPKLQEASDALEAWPTDATTASTP